jgi:hypothetical protein
LESKIPSVHSNVWARSENKIVFFGGRADGFHGLIEIDNPFRSKMANDIIYVLNLDDLTYSWVQLDPNSEYFLQMTASNCQFCQNDDSLYLTGGFGRKSMDSKSSNYTFNSMLIFNIPELIESVENKSQPYSSISNCIEDDYLQVTGGKMKYLNGYFYLMFGQNFHEKYDVGITGEYTEAIRKFKIDGNSLTQKSSLQYKYLHRRDLNVERLYNTNYMIAYGGVFTKNNNGYPNPVQILADSNEFSCKQMENIEQVSNQYDCAVVSVYDPQRNSNSHVFLGGIGKNQFHESTQSWECGDLGALLPFVQTITKMTWVDGVLLQDIQLPPASPQLPALLGANAMFFPDSSVMLEDNVVDYSKISSGTSPIGIFYGGIVSQRPTSSAIYPSSLNTKVYDVMLTKLDSNDPPHSTS